MFESSAVCCALRSKPHVSVSKLISGLAATVLLTLLLPVAASAYTLVMRSGRRVEIPARFTVTSTIVTYEVSAGIAYTVQLSGVDLAATERINGEPAGSFINRAAKTSVQTEAPALPSGPAKRSFMQRAMQKVVTNETLEASRPRGERRSRRASARPTRLTPEGRVAAFHRRARSKVARAGAATRSEPHGGAVRSPPRRGLNA